ncbi:unnamed protein product [Hydatigera taeniaeformis]|uniref:DNA replication ATP-dependent helicase/nuclease n=1 Tax=Hydatigena taeniaeformis TaxID=6205 RepID=A0A0R3WSI9_HYDTA|nr:unnamed protein product [Hydatigera taeniaeformis]
MTKNGDKTTQFSSPFSASYSKLDVVNKPMIKEVFDVEENIWCTKFGVKGKIDMTVVCSTDSQTPPSLIPLELKTGKPSFSYEHQGQVLLYLLMLADRHANRVTNVANYGWLVYLRQTDQSYPSDLVKPQASSFRGLIQTRNHLAASLRRLAFPEESIGGVEEGKTWELPLPPPLYRQRICSWCPYLFACEILRGHRYVYCAIVSFAILASDFYI